MLEEMESIEENGTWELTNLPLGHYPIGLKWVFKLKKNAAGVVIKHKAYMVMKGCVQLAGIDFNEIFATRSDSIHALIAIAVQMGWEVHHLDVKSVFLNDDLAEELYVAQPPGFIYNGDEYKVLRLYKVLYSL